MASVCCSSSARNRSPIGEESQDDEKHPPPNRNMEQSEAVHHNYFSRYKPSPVEVGDICGTMQTAKRLKAAVQNILMLKRQHPATMHHAERELLNASLGDQEKIFRDSLGNQAELDGTSAKKPPPSPHLGPVKNNSSSPRRSSDLPDSLNFSLMYDHKSYLRHAARQARARGFYIVDVDEFD